MASRVKVKVNRRVSFPSHMSLTVGILEHSGAPHGDSGLTIGEIAEKHEFGQGVPVRSFLRAWFDQHAEELGKTAGQMMRKCRTVGQFRQALEVVGAVASSGVQEYIATGNVKPAITSPVTIARKQARGFRPPFVPLVETGALKSAISAKSEVTR